ncbi:hypothetical protein B0H39_006007 [Clostridium beijerinckii]|uniref:hypothetical protein n=1 Tax=Clostridium beijerinckii TaxID=1520 RepID=UPI0014944424|nr:hypothetical protein [Clostridium beijerinckii]NOW87976.1 hypothetical protein [Clostridium beijerinckii]
MEDKNNVDVNEVLISKEAASKLNIDSAYLVRLAKELKRQGKIKDSDMRLAGTRTYIFNAAAINVLKSALKRK